MHWLIIGFTRPRSMLVGFSHIQCNDYTPIHTATSNRVETCIGFGSHTRSIKMYTHIQVLIIVLANTLHRPLRLTW